MREKREVIGVEKRGGGEGPISDLGEKGRR